MKQIKGKRNAVATCVIDGKNRIRFDGFRVDFGGLLTCRIPDCFPEHINDIQRPFFFDDYCVGLACSYVFSCYVILSNHHGESAGLLP